MRTRDVVRGSSKVLRRGRRNTLLAFVAIAAIAVVVAVLAWAALLAKSEVVAEDANPNAGVGSAVIHDDADNVNRRHRRPTAQIIDDRGAGVFGAERESKGRHEAHPRQGLELQGGAAVIEPTGLDPP